MSDARDEFARLIEVSATESEFQKLFTECPNILSDSLPLRIADIDIEPMGTPGRSEPDFIFFPRNRRSIGDFGVIELKRPDSKILTVTRKNIVTLSRDAETAISQCEHYLNSTDFKHLTNQKNSIVLGAKGHMFVIMGVAEELLRKTLDDFSTRQLERRIPSNCLLLPYDVLLEKFTNAIGTRVHILVPSITRRKRVLFVDGGLRSGEKSIGEFLIEVFGRLIGTDLSITRYDRMDEFTEEFYRHGCDFVVIMMNPEIEEIQDNWKLVTAAPGYEETAFMFITNPVGYDPQGRIRTSAYLREGHDSSVTIPFRILDIAECLANLLKSKGA